MIIPIFTSDYSIGRSILKIKPSETEGGPDDILTIAQNNLLKEVYIVEDNMIGFLDTYKAFHNTDIILHYGVRFNICNDVSDNDEKNTHKVIVFARDTEGCKSLFNLFSIVSCQYNGVMDYNILFKYWDFQGLLLAHPFYDSYLYHNTFHFKNCMPTQGFISDGIYLYENNKLPHDEILGPKVLKQNNVVHVKSIFYKNRVDFMAYQTYRMACNRRVGKKTPTLSLPNVEHFASDNFCFESYLEENERATKI